MSNRVITKTQQCLERLGLRGSRLVVAVSGGPDSLALTLALADLREPLDLDLHLAHLDHQLRPDSAADAHFVADVARLLDIPLSAGRVDVRRAAEREHLGIEEAARRERYRFLARVCEEVNAAAVVVAHTADDQSETRLMHWLRGSGLHGLLGMVEDCRLEVAESTQIRIVRPLLDVRRQETEEFCGGRGLEPRRDPSNHDLACTRNYLRHEILPRLRALNPRLDDSIARLARASADAEDFVQSELDRRLPRLARSGPTQWTVDRAAWAELPAALKRALLQRAFEALNDTRGAIDARNVEDGVRAADSWTSGRTLTWPGGIELRVEHNHFLIRRHAIPTAGIAAVELPIADNACVPLVARQSETNGAALVRLRRRAMPCPDRFVDRWHCDLDGAKLAVARSLVVRARQPGDWLMPAGMTGRKKVQDLLVDARIPRDERDQVPIVATPEGIAWVAGVRRDRRFLAGPNCQDVLCITVESERKDEPVA